MAGRGISMTDGSNWEAVPLAAYEHSWMMVGRFMFHWAMMESTINSCVAAISGLDYHNGAIICKNMSLQNKLAVCRSAIDLYMIKKDEADLLKGTFHRVSNLTGLRNMCAHDFFGPSREAKGVEFTVVKAKNGYGGAYTFWSDEQLDKHIAAITDLEVELSDILKRIKVAVTIDQAYALLKGMEDDELAATSREERDDGHTQAS
jgi:hypothetical protein